MTPLWIPFEHLDPQTSSFQTGGGGGTQVIIEIILKFWNIVYVKTQFKGKHKRLEDANPIYDLNDNRITWMTEFLTWLYKWR